MQSDQAKSNEPYKVGMGERIVIWTAFALVTVVSMIGYRLNGETGFWVALVLGLVAFTILHGVFNTQLRAFYGRFKPNKYDGVVDDAMRVTSFFLRK